MKRMKSAGYVLAVLVSACGSNKNGGPAESPPQTTPSTGDAPMPLHDDDRKGQGNAVQVQLDGADLARYQGDKITLEGALFIAEDGTTYLCSVLDESYPPQCGGTSVKLSGADSTRITLEGKPADKVKWSTKSVIVTGVMRGSDLEVESMHEAP